MKTKGKSLSLGAITCPKCGQRGDLLGKLYFDKRFDSWRFSFVVEHRKYNPLLYREQKKRYKDSREAQRHSCFSYDKTCYLRSISISIGSLR